MTKLKIIAVILSISLITTSITLDIHALSSLAPPQTQSFLYESLNNNSNQKPIVNANNKNIDQSIRNIPRLFIKNFLPIFCLSYLIMYVFDIPSIIIALVFVVEGSLLNGCLFLVHHLKPRVIKNPFHTINKNFKSPLISQPKHPISIAYKITSNLLGIIIFGTAINTLIFFIVPIFYSPILIPAYTSMMVIFVIYVIITVSGKFPVKKHYSKKQKDNMISKLNDTSDNLFTSALRKKDILLLESLNLVKGFGIMKPTDYNWVIQNGKDSERNLILFTINLLKYKNLMRYLIVRRAIGFRYDAFVKYFAFNRNTAFHMIWLRMFWEIYSNFQLLKRWRYFPLMVPYIIVHSMQFNLVALVMLIPLSIINLHRMFSAYDRKILKDLIKMLMGDMKVPTQKNTYEQFKTYSQILQST